MVAQQDQTVTIKDRRAGVAPIEIEAGILSPEMAFPGELAIDVERRKLPVAEPRVDVGAVGDGARRGEIAFLVDIGQVAFRIQVVVPEAASVGCVVRRDTEADPVVPSFGARSAERRLAQISRVASPRLVWPPTTGPCRSSSSSRATCSSAIST